MTAQEYAITTADWLLKKAGLLTYTELRRLVDILPLPCMDKESHLR